MGFLIPPSESSLDDLIAAAQANAVDDSVAMNEIVRRFEPLVQRLGTSISSNPHLQQDVAQEMRLALVKAVQSHQLGTPGFPSYARRYMRGAGLRFVTAMAHPEVSVDPQDDYWAATRMPRTTLETTVEIIDLFDILDAEQRRVAVARYVADKRLREIASDLGISAPAVSQRLRTIHRVLHPVLDAVVAA